MQSGLARFAQARRFRISCTRDRARAKAFITFGMDLRWVSPK